MSNIERNERVIALASRGRSFSEIAQMLQPEYPGLSREAVAGIVKRAHDKQAKQQNLPTGRILPKARLQTRGHDHEARQALKAPSQPPKPISPPRPPAEPISKYEKPLPDGRTGVPYEERTGCSWPTGDAREGGLTFCNAPRCRVTRHSQNGAVSWRTPYCETHWKARRRSAYTKVLA